MLLDFIGRYSPNNPADQHKVRQLVVMSAVVREVISTIVLLVSIVDYIATSISKLPYVISPKKLSILTSSCSVPYEFSPRPGYPR